MIQIDDTSTILLRGCVHQCVVSTWCIAKVSKHWRLRYFFQIKKNEKRDLPDPNLPDASDMPDLPSKFCQDAQCKSTNRFWSPWCVCRAAVPGGKWNWSQNSCHWCRAIKYQIVSVCCLHSCFLFMVTRSVFNDIPSHLICSSSYENISTTGKVKEAKVIQYILAWPPTQEGKEIIRCWHCRVASLKSSWIKPIVLSLEFSPWCSHCFPHRKQQLFQGWAACSLLALEVLGAFHCRKDAMGSWGFRSFSQLLLIERYGLEMAGTSLKARAEKQGQSMQYGRRGLKFLRSSVN